jgi:hypothetical protein
MRGCRGRDNAGPDGAHPLTEFILADYLVVVVAKPYAGQDSLREIELAARRCEVHRTRGGRALAHWLVSRTSPAASTVRGYAAHVRLYLCPYLGGCC